MGRREQQIEHLLRRAGFGGSPNEIDFYSEIGVRGTIDLLTYFEQIPDDVDSKIGQPGLARRRWRSSGTTTSPPPTPRSPAPMTAPRRPGCWPPSRRRTATARRAST